MSFEPGGDPRIPNQIGTTDHGRSDQAHSAGPRQPGSPQALARSFRRVALINSVLLIGAVLAVYGFGLVDPDIGLWLIIGAALVGGALMIMLVLGHQRRRMRGPQGRPGQITTPGSDS